MVTDLIIYRPDKDGNLIEVATLADQALSQNSNPNLQWGDIVVFRLGTKSPNKQQMPLVHYASGLEPRTIALKVGNHHHKIRIENTHQGIPGLALHDHFNAETPAVDLSKIVLRRANGKSKTLNLTLPREPQKIRLMEGDTIEYSFLPQTHHASIKQGSPSTRIHLFFPDRPTRTPSDGYGRQIPLGDLLHFYSVIDERDFSKVTIQRMSEEGLERIPLDFTAVTNSLTDNEDSLAKAPEFLKTTIYPGDILIFPPKENLSWDQVNNFTHSTQCPEIGPLIKLVTPAKQIPPPGVYPPRPSSISPKPTSTSKRSSAPNVRRVPSPPSR